MTAPALAIAVPLVLGVLLGSSSRGELPFVAPALVAIWLFTGIALWWRSKTNDHSRWRTILVLALVCAGCVGAGVQLGSHARRAAEQPTLLAWYEQQDRSERPVHLIGVL